MSSSSTQEPERSRFSEFASDALRYWEPRRVIYNIVLASAVLTHLVSGWPGTQRLLTPDRVMVTFILAVLANIAYCAAYAADLFVQFAGVRDAWSRLRWVLWTIGTLFGATLTHFIVKSAIETWRN